MADTKISALTSLTGAGVDVAADLLPIVDNSVTTTKKITVGELLKSTFNALFDISGASGGQIKFPAAQNAAADANTLDDYEEGTFTPADGSGAGLALTLNGSQLYVKVGQLCYVAMDITYPATADVSTAIISGFPFTSAATASALAIGYSNSAKALNALVGASVKTITFYQAGGGSAITNADLTTARIRISGCYRTDG